MKLLLENILFKNNLVGGKFVRKKNPLGVLTNLTLVSQIGISMVLPILGGVWAGHWLDERFGTKILFLIVFVFLGIGASFYSLYELTSKGINKRK